MWERNTKKVKKAYLKKTSRERDIAEVLRGYDKEVQPKGSCSVPMDTRVYRVRVVEQFLKCGVPLKKIDGFRHLLEEGCLRLTHSSHLSDYIPVIHQEEKKKIFDGSSRLGEALAIVIRFISGWSIKQKVVRMSMLAKSLKGEELAREILSALSTDLGVSGSHLMAAMHDRASVNIAAMSIVSIMYPNILDVGCFSHTLDLVGRKFTLQHVDKFMKHWEVIFKHSYKSKLLWCEQTGISIKSYSPTRWWSRWDCAKQVMEMWGDVYTFLQNNKDAAPKSREKLIELLETCPGEVLVDLAVYVDAGEGFVKATYLLEGDGPLVFDCYEIIAGVRSAIQVSHWPNTKSYC